MYCWWFRKPAPIEVGSLPHYLKGFIRPKGGDRRISSINSILWVHFQGTLATLDLRQNALHPGIVARLRRTMEEKRSLGWDRVMGEGEAFAWRIIPGLGSPRPWACETPSKWPTSIADEWGLWDDPPPSGAWPNLGEANGKTNLGEAMQKWWVKLVDFCLHF